MTKTRRVATHAEIDKILALLRDHCKRDADGFAVYAEGWDDDRVAREAGVTANHVKNRRTAIYGNLITSPAAALKAAESEVLSLRREVQRLTTRHTALFEDHNATKAIVKRLETEVTTLYERMGEPRPAMARLV